jgi:hypothetical protein
MKIEHIVGRYFDGEWSVVAWCNPNRLGVLAHIEQDGQHIVFFEDNDPDLYDPMRDMECHSKKEAERIYQKWRAGLLETPNWEAQREYDERHGTVNGEDPRIAEAKEMWGW